MMRRYTLLIQLSMLLLQGNLAMSQSTGSGSLSEVISKVKYPSSPAAIIIGNQQSAITRPKSWEALEASIFTNNISDQGFSIPKDYAVEFSPYWAQENLKVSVEDYLLPPVGLTLLQNASFSVSTTQNFIIRDSVNTNAVGFGFRTMLWQGAKGERDKVKEYLNEIRNNTALSNRIFAHSLQVITTGCGSCSREVFITALVKGLEQKRETMFSSSISDELFQKFMTGLRQTLSEKLPLQIDSTNTWEVLEIVSDRVDALIELDTFVENLSKLRQDRKGFKTELAGALALDFPTNEADFSVVPQFSFWVIPSYQPFDTDWVEFLGLVRYTRYNLEGFYDRYVPDAGLNTYENSLDFGLRIAFKKEKYSLEFEGVGRRNRTVADRFIDDNGMTHTLTRSANDSQFIVNFNYHINESISISYNFGKQFDPIVSYNGTLVSFAALNFGINGPKKLDVTH